MPVTLGLVGDLCLETEWIWRRLRCVRQSMARCDDRVLLDRLHREVHQYVQRCLEISTIQQHLSPFIDEQSLHWMLLLELTNRSLFEVSVMSND